MRKNRIRLTESGLRRIVSESVRRVLNEHKPLYTNGDKELKLGSDYYDPYVYHYDNDGNKVKNSFKDLSKHNKRALNYNKQKTTLQQDKEELLPMLKTLGISVREWMRMSPEEKQCAFSDYEEFVIPFNRGYNYSQNFPDEDD